MLQHRATAARLRALRADRGLSPEQLSFAIQTAGLGYVSGHTIRRAEEGKRNPTARVQYAIAAYFDLRPTELWPVEAQPVRRSARRDVVAQQRVAA